MAWKPALGEPFPLPRCLMTLMIVLCQYFLEWRDMWTPLSPFARIFLILLVLLGIYEFYFASFVLLRLRSLRTESVEDALRKALTTLDHRSSNLGQFVLTMFFLFGFVFFVQMQNAFWTPESNRPVSLMVLENFRTVFHFATLMFFSFLVLQCVQWFVSARIRAALRRFPA